MIWSVAEIVAFFSHFYTLQPGLLLETGTPGGTAWATDPEIGGKPFERDDVVRKGYLQVGDVVRVEIEGIGSLSNPIVAAPRRRPKEEDAMSLLIPDTPTLFLNARLIDGEGGEPVENAAVKVEGNLITAVGRTPDFGENPNGNLRVVDLEGKTLMPGLIEGHFHISFWGVRELPDLDLKLPAERTTVYAVKNAELALRCGYTGVASAGALHRIDVTIRDMVNEGIIPGPRMAASGRDICATSGMLDWNPSFWKLGMDGLSIFADGVDEVRKAVAPEHQRGRRRHQAVRHRRGPAAARTCRPRRRCTPSRRSRRRRGGAQAQPPGRRARARQRRRQALRRGRRRRARARHLRRRRGDRA